MEVILLVIIFAVLGVLKLRDLSYNVAVIKSDNISREFREKYGDKEMEESILRKIENDNNKESCWTEVSDFLSTCPDCDLQTMKKFAFTSNKSANYYYLVSIVLPILMAKQGKIPLMMLDGLYVEHGDKLLGNPMSFSLQFAKNIVDELRKYDRDIDLMFVKSGCNYKFYWNKNPHKMIGGQSVIEIKNQAAG